MMNNKFVSELKTFLMRGNVIDMAVGIVIGGAFTGIVKSLVDDVIMPPIGLLLGGVDFSNLFIVLKDGAVAAPYATLAAAKEAGAVTMNIGLFINTIISFLIVGIAVFSLVKIVNLMTEKAKAKEAEEVKAAEAAKAPARICPYCCNEIAAKATRCPHCTSELKDVA